MHLAETGHTHTRERRDGRGDTLHHSTRGINTHTMETIGGQYSDINFHTSSAQHQWDNKSNHNGRNHPHGSEFGATASDTRSAYSVNKAAKP